MLTEIEKKEIKIDAESKKRREDFQKGKSFSLSPRSFDEYIKFLDSLQKIYPSPDVAPDKTITRFNKL